jgi:hypothetical protein
MFRNPQEIAQQTRESFAQKAPSTVTVEDVNARYQAQRAREQAEAAAERLASQRKRFAMLHQNLKEYQERIRDVRRELQRWETEAQATQNLINELTHEDGFEFPQPAPATKVAPSKPVATPAPKVVAEPENTYTTTKYAVCEHCGSNIVEGIAFHRLPEGEGLYCILDVKRARNCLSPTVIEQNLERMANLKANQLDQ